MNEINNLLYEVRRCLIEVPTLTPSTKAFFLMTLDLHHHNFRSISRELDQFYGSILERHDASAQLNKPPVGDPNEDDVSPQPISFNLRNLKKDFSNLQIGGRSNGNGRKDRNTRINREFLNRPLKAHDRLKSFQHVDADDYRQDEPHSLPVTKQPANTLPQLTIDTCSEEPRSLPVSNVSTPLN